MNEQITNEQTNNSKLISAITYVIYFPMKNDKSMKSTMYFIPDNNIEINIKNNFYYESLGTDYINIQKTDKPKNIYKLKSNGPFYEAKLENIFVEKKWVDKCLKIYEAEQQIKNLKNEIFFGAPDHKSYFDKLEDCFNFGMKCFESQNFEMGRNYFSKCLELLNGNKSDEYYILSYYNISCCYARENNNELSLLFLSNAVMNGYTNWAHTIIDKDMEPLLENPHFIELIKLMMQKNPTRQVTSEIPKKINFIDIYLKKNNLCELEKIN